MAEFLDKQKLLAWMDLLIADCREIAGGNMLVLKVCDIHQGMRDMVAKQPAVDAVEVVLCKDCRYCKRHPTSERVKRCTNENWNTEYHPLVVDGGYCSYGERRADNG